MFIKTDPWLPPIIKITGLLFLNLQISFPFISLPNNNSFLIGVPVNSTFLSLINFLVSGNVIHIFFIKGIEILFASPGVMSDSWEITGILFLKALNITGIATNPPFEKITFGLSNFKIHDASKIPFTTLNGSLKLFKSKYLLSFPVFIP